MQARVHGVEKIVQQVGFLRRCLHAWLAVARTQSGEELHERLNIVESTLAVEVARRLETQAWAVGVERRFRGLEEVVQGTTAMLTHLREQMLAASLHDRLHDLEGRVATSAARAADSALVQSAIDARLLDVEERLADEDKLMSSPIDTGVTVIPGLSESFEAKVSALGDQVAAAAASVAAVPDVSSAFGNEALQVVEARQGALEAKVFSLEEELAAVTVAAVASSREAVPVAGKMAKAPEAVAAESGCKGDATCVGAYSMSPPRRRKVALEARLDRLEAQLSTSKELKVTLERLVSRPVHESPTAHASEQVSERATAVMAELEVRMRRIEEQLVEDQIAAVFTRETGFGIQGTIGQLEAPDFRRRIDDLERSRKLLAKGLGEVERRVLHVERLSMTHLR